jgi:hypothetical protein
MSTAWLLSIQERNEPRDTEALDPIGIFTDEITMETWVDQNPVADNFQYVALQYEMNGGICLEEKKP